ncbi:MAG: DUF302 domain-containing protein [Gammaproteobacteria bacterium]|nr:DUF302 domain-containing protein [Gammaproteobacteria bacterium]
MKKANFGKNLLTPLLLGVSLAAAWLMTAPAFANSDGFVKIESQHDFDATVSALKEAVSSNKMMVMGDINQARVLSMTGLRLAGAESFLVGNPQMGKQAFDMDPAAGAVLPARIYVWSDHGKTYVGYFKPSDQLDQVSPGFSKMGHMLDMKLDMIAKTATR